MSSCLILQTKNRSFIGTDSALSSFSNNKFYRSGNNEQKIFFVSDYIYFCSGESNHVKKTKQYINSIGDFNFDLISKFLLSICINKANKNYFDIELMAINKKNNIVYQISQYNNFELKTFIPSEDGIQILSAGFKTNECSLFAENQILLNKDVKTIYRNTFNNLECEQIGGDLIVYSISSNTIDIFYSNKIDKKVYFPNYDIQNQYHLLIADVVVGRLLAGNSLLITNDDGSTTKTFTLDQNGAVLENASFTIENAKSRILLDPTNGIKVQKNTTPVTSAVTSWNVTTASGAGTNSATWSHTIASGGGGNRLLVVCVSVRALHSVQSITYSGVPLTNLTSVFVGSGGNVPRSEIWYLISPPLGTANIITTLTGSDYFECGAVNYTNVDQSAPFDSTVTGQGVSATASVTLIGSTGDMFIDVLGYSGTTSTPGGSQTSLFNLTSDGTWKGSGSKRLASGVSVNMTWTIPSTGWAQCGTTIKYALSTATWTDKFYVDVNGDAFFAGDITGSSGTFSGNLSAAGGTFTGTLIGVNGYFSGDITGATGTFNGAINAISGNIGTWQITPLGLSNDLAACNLNSTAEGGADIRLGNLVSVRNSDGSNAWMDFTGNNAALRGSTSVILENLGGIYFEITASEIQIDGNTCVTQDVTISGTTLHFVRGFFIGT
jgi:hypothetical protein